MIYEFKKWESLDDKRAVQWARWETNKKAEDGICGKLLKYKGFIENIDGKKILSVPESVQIIATGAFVGLGAEDKEIDSFIVPASVEVLEEGALGNIHTKEIHIAPDSKCAVVKGKGVYSIDGKVLLYYFGDYCWDGENEVTFTVPNGVLKIGEEAFWGCGPITLELPDSITEIWYEKANLLGEELKADHTYYAFTIRASKNSFAAKFAKQNNIKFEEI